MSKPGFEFELLAAKYNLGGVEYAKPAVIQLAEDDPRLPQFQSCPGFSSGKPIELMVVTNETELKASSKEEAGNEETGFVLDGVSEEIIDKLIESGFDSAEKILSEDVKFDDLIAIKGIGEATANKIIEACEEIISLDESEEDESNENKGDNE